jgi:CysZ protein
MSDPKPLRLPNHPANAPSAFLKGMSLPFEAVDFLSRRPLLLLLMLIPIAINLVLFFAVLGWGFHEFSDFLGSLLDEKTAWYWTTLKWVIQILFYLIVLAIVFFIFTPIALIIAAPFNDQLAEKVEHAAGFQIEDKRSFLVMVREEIIYAVFSEAKRMSVVLGVFILLLPVNFIPVIGPLLFGILSFLWGAWSAAIEFTSFAADRRHLGTREKWRQLRSNLPLTMGFGTATILLLGIPLINVFAVALSAVGGTVLFGMLQRDDAQGAVE